MRAVEISKPGGPEVLKPVERPKPAPKDGEILIKVAAAGVNRPDIAQRAGLYPPPPGGSRFRGPNDPGVFYGADQIRTACAELGYWRWRHLQDSPALAAMPTKPQTVFQVKIEIDAVDLRAKPFARDRERWTDASDYAQCQGFGRIARAAGIGAIRYASVRDPRHEACCAVLSPAAFVPPIPLEQQTWMLSVGRERVIWQRTHALHAEEHEFDAAQWSLSAH